MLQCRECGKDIEEELEGKFVAYDLQKKKEENFCLTTVNIKEVQNEY